jgi:uncharacterized damage-inducible protein DinB
MMTRRDEDAQLGKSLIESWVVCARMTEIVLEELEPEAWRVTLAGPGGKGRTIAAIVAHTHNVRRKWLRLSAPQLKLPAALNRLSCTQDEARAALTESSARCAEMIASALGDSENKVESFHRDGWAKAWPAGAAMVAYMMTHEAHHRGQVCMLAHQLGFPLEARVTAEMWSWERLWKECGFGLVR